MTRRDLSAIGAFLVLGLIGNLVSSLVNIFMAPSAL
jgi:FtsH-binding integral membrane protein